MAAGGVNRKLRNVKEFEMDECDFLLGGSFSGDVHMGDHDNELDVAKYYRNLYSVALGNRKSRKVSQSSKFVQTDPDTSGVPPSWIIAGQSIVNDLYTGLGNIINTLYHSPNINGANTQQKDPNEFNLSKTNMKYFKYENGYFVSKLMPNIKFPADVKGDDNKEILSSAHLKKKFKELLDLATKLRNSVPYIYEDLNTLKCEDGEIQPKVTLSKSQQTEDDWKPCLCKMFSNLNVGNKSNASGVLSKPGYSMSGDKDKNITVGGVQPVEERNENTKQQQSADTTTLSPITEDNGVTVTKCKIHKHVNRSGRGVKNTTKKIPSAMNDLAKNKSNDRISSLKDCGLILVRKPITNSNSDGKCDLTAATCSSSGANQSNLERLNQVKNTGARAKEYKAPSDVHKSNSKESKTNRKGPSRVKPEAMTSDAGSKNFILRNIKAAKNAHAACRAFSNKVRD